MTAVGTIALLLFEKWGPVIADKLLKEAFPNDPVAAQWSALFGGWQNYDAMRAQAFKDAGKVPTPLPPMS